MSQGSNLPIAGPVVAPNGVTVESNPKHTPGNPGYSSVAGTEPKNSLDIFGNSMPGGDGVRYGVDADGAINRFFDNGNGVYHWSGSTSDGGNPLRPESIPIRVRRALGYKGK